MVAGQHPFDGGWGYLFVDLLLKAKGHFDQRQGGVFSEKVKQNCLFFGTKHAPSTTIFFVVTIISIFSIAVEPSLHGGG